MTTAGSFRGPGALASSTSMGSRSQLTVPRSAIDGVSGTTSVTSQRIPAGQVVGAGAYADVVQSTVNF